MKIGVVTGFRLEGLHSNPPEGERPKRLLRNNGIVSKTIIDRRKVSRMIVLSSNSETSITALRCQLMLVYGVG